MKALTEFGYKLSFYTRANFLFCCKTKWEQIGTSGLAWKQGKKRWTLERYKDGEKERKMREKKRDWEREGEVFL